jgi:aminopeptidase N
LKAVCIDKPVATTPSINYRLPKPLKPFSYDINVTILFDTSIEPSVFDGSVEIRFSCEEKTNHIVLNKAYLDIDESSILLIQLLDEIQIDVINLSYDSIKQLYDLNVSNSLEIGKIYSLSMKYKGYIQTDGLGFYKSNYYDANRNLKWVVTSQMEAIGARNAFPCFDEPEMKSIFKLTVIHNQNLEAMSNMPGNLTLL